MDKYEKLLQLLINAEKEYAQRSYSSNEDEKKAAQMTVNFIRDLLVKAGSL